MIVYKKAGVIMATKLYPYRAECDKSGMIVHFKARDTKDAENKLMATVAYWQSSKKYKTTIKDWVISQED